MTEEAAAKQSDTSKRIIIHGWHRISGSGRGKIFKYRIASLYFSVC